MIANTPPLIILGYRDSMPEMGRTGVGKTAGGSDTGEKSSKDAGGGGTGQVGVISRHSLPGDAFFFPDNSETSRPLSLSTISEFFFVEAV